MSEIILRTKDLTKKYGSRTVVDNLNIEIRRGEIFGLLGPNGAGKSTTMNMICSIVRPTAGSVELLGKNPWKQKKDVIHKLGYIPQELAIYGKRSLFYLLASGPFGATGHFFCFFLASLVVKSRLMLKFFVLFFQLHGLCDIMKAIHRKQGGRGS